MERDNGEQAKTTMENGDTSVHSRPLDQVQIEMMRKKTPKMARGATRKFFRGKSHEQTDAIRRKQQSEEKEGEERRQPGFHSLH